METDYEILAAFSLDLAAFGNNILGEMEELITYHNNVGGSWRDGLYEEFSANIREIKQKIEKEMTDLAALGKLIGLKAVELYQLEWRLKGGSGV